MHGKSEKKFPRAKSYTSIYDIFGPTPFNNVLYNNPRRSEKEQTVFQATCGDSSKIPVDSNNSHLLNATPLVTSEKYHLLNRDASHKSIVRSTSTIFYDLDDIAKRHSFHCLTEITLSCANVMNVSNIPTNQNRFGGKSIVQECATQIQPKLIPRDSVEVKLKKFKTFPNDVELSSEIFLRDNVYDRQYSKSQYSNGEMTNRHQKFWSYAKYRTEYTKPIPEEKKIKKKDRGKRTEDPCPCQLFSYACPCTDKKSLTELARNSKSLTVADQITSTPKIISEVKKDTKDTKRSKIQKHDSVKEDKPTNTSFVNKVDIIIPRREPVAQVANKQDVTDNQLLDTNQNDLNSSKSKRKSHKRTRKITCPNCKEKVDIVSTTEDEECLRRDTNSSVYRNNTSPKTASKLERNDFIDDGDICEHEPRCEYVPMCQILPTDNIYLNHKNTKKQTSPRTSPRVIRITKACRHHPPCTVVPSCQRATVLRNNCEFIPPCLHRPRCVNLPLCVPYSKSFHYDEPMNKAVDDIDSSECPHNPKCKYIPMCQHDSLANNTDHQIDIAPRVQNTCEYLNEYSPAFVINPKATCISDKYSPQMFFPNTCNFCKSDKSCQYQCTNLKWNPTNTANESISEDAVVFIRDVGCQYRNKNYSLKDSMLQSKNSSASFDMVDVKMGNYYTDVHTLRYQDKFTSPLSCEDLSLSTGSVTSVEIDSHCPSHGHQATRYQKSRQTGFNPKCGTTPFVATMIAKTDSDFVYSKKEKEFRRPDGLTYPVISRRSFLKGKYKKIFPVKRRRKSRASSVMVRFNSKKPIYPDNNM